MSYSCCIILFYISIQEYVKDSGDHVNKMVDSLLDSLTDGEHSKTKEHIKQVSSESLMTSLWRVETLCFKFEDIYIILDGFECDTRIYCWSYDNIERVGDVSNIVIAIYSCITQKQSHIILLLLSISRWLAK